MDARVCNGINVGHNKRQIDDFYATDPNSVKALLDVEKFSSNIWEPACGNGQISEVLKSYGYNVRSSDIIQREYDDMTTLDFLSDNSIELDCDIITNPPYSLATEFCYRSIHAVSEGHKIAMLLKLTFLETKSRLKLFAFAPPPICVRVQCATKMLPEWRYEYE